MYRTTGKSIEHDFRCIFPACHLTLHNKLIFLIEKLSNFINLGLSIFIYLSSVCLDDAMHNAAKYLPLLVQIDFFKYKTSIMRLFNACKIIT